MMWAKQKGFTIVELLIVIVVIAILAAVTIVAYTGIQQRAKNAQVISGTNAYYKAFLNYKTINGSYPSSGGCLGAGYPNGVTNHAVSATLDAALAEYLGGTKPTLATQRFSIGIGTYNRAGAIYSTTSGLKIVYYLQGANEPCGISGATGITEGNVVTQCQLLLL